MRHGLRRQDVFMPLMRRALPRQVGLHHQTNAVLAVATKLSETMKTVFGHLIVRRPEKNGFVLFRKPTD